MHHMFFFLLIAILMLLKLDSDSKKDDEIVSKIRKDARKKGFHILEVREPVSTDGKNPFGRFWRIGLRRRVGTKKEKAFNKIVMVRFRERTIKYWVKVRIFLFKPQPPKWKKIG